MKVLITGGSSGIGKSIANYMYDLGYEIIIVGRDQEKLDGVRNMLGRDVVIEKLDLGIYDNCFKLFNKYKDVDILINNAGFGLFGEFSKTDINKEMQMIDVNIRAVHVLMKLYLVEMKKRNSGYILNVASIAGFMPGPLMDTYYASKSYVVGLSQGVYEELRREGSGVRISVLCPGPVKTNFDNVADVKFSLKGFSSDYVSKYAIKSMFRGKFIIIPGFKIKLLKFVSKFIPDSVMAKFVYMSQRRKGV